MLSDLRLLRLGLEEKHDTFGFTNKFYEEFYAIKEIWRREIFHERKQLKIEFSSDQLVMSIFSFIFVIVFTLNMSG